MELIHSHREVLIAIKAFRTHIMTKVAWKDRESEAEHHRGRCLFLYFSDLHLFYNSYILLSSFLLKQVAKIID